MVVVGASPAKKLKTTEGAVGAVVSTATVPSASVDVLGNFIKERQDALQKKEAAKKKEEAAKKKEEAAKEAENYLSSDESVCSSTTSESDDEPDSDASKSDSDSNSSVEEKREKLDLDEPTHSTHREEKRLRHVRSLGTEISGDFKCWSKCERYGFRIEMVKQRLWELFTVKFHLIFNLGIKNLDYSTVNSSPLIQTWVLDCIKVYQMGHFLSTKINPRKHLIKSSFTSYHYRKVRMPVQRLFKNLRILFAELVHFGGKRKNQSTMWSFIFKMGNRINSDKVKETIQFEKIRELFTEGGSPLVYKFYEWNRSKPKEVCTRHTSWWVLTSNDKKSCSKSIGVPVFGSFGEVDFSNVDLTFSFLKVPPPSGRHPNLQGAVKMEVFSFPKGVLISNDVSHDISNGNDITRFMLEKGGDRAWEITQIRGDGNCLYRAVYYLLLLHYLRPILRFNVHDAWPSHRISHNYIYSNARKSKLREFSLFLQSAVPPPSSTYAQQLHARLMEMFQEEKLISFEEAVRKLNEDDQLDWALIFFVKQKVASYLLNPPSYARAENQLRIESARVALIEESKPPVGSVLNGQQECFPNFDSMDEKDVLREYCHRIVLPPTKYADSLVVSCLTECLQFGVNVKVVSHQHSQKHHGPVYFIQDFKNNRRDFVREMQYYGSEHTVGPFTADALSINLFYHSDAQHYDALHPSIDLFATTGESSYHYLPIGIIKNPDEKYNMSECCKAGYIEQKVREALLLQGEDAVSECSD